MRSTCRSWSRCNVCRAAMNATSKAGSNSATCSVISAANRLWRAELRRGDHVPRPLRGRLQLADVRISRRTTVRLGEMRGGGHANTLTLGRPGSKERVSVVAFGRRGTCRSTVNRAAGPRTREDRPRKARQLHLDPQRQSCDCGHLPSLSGLTDIWRARSRALAAPGRACVRVGPSRQLAMRLCARPTKPPPKSGHVAVVTANR